MDNLNIAQPQMKKKKSQIWLLILFGSLLLSGYLTLVIGDRNRLIGFIGFLLFLFGPLIATIVKSRDEKTHIEKSIPSFPPSKILKSIRRGAILGMISSALTLIISLIIYFFPKTWKYYFFLSFYSFFLWASEVDWLEEISEILEEKEINQNTEIGLEYYMNSQKAKINLKRKTTRSYLGEKFILGFFLFIIFLSIIQVILEEIRR